MGLARIQLPTRIPKLFKKKKKILKDSRNFYIVSQRQRHAKNLKISKGFPPSEPVVDHNVFIVLLMDFQKTKKPLLKI